MNTFMTNSTTYENIIMYKIRGVHEDFENPFDVGVVNNMKQFLGDSVWTWLIPILPKRTPDAGTQFPMRPGTNESFV